MKKKQIILISIFLLFGFCNAQTKLPEGIELKKSTSSYFLNNKSCYSVTYEYSNRSNQIMWLWIEKNIILNLSDLEKIRGYFLKKKKGGDASFYQIGMDGGIGTFIPSIFDSFIKCILPNKKFSIQIISNRQISEKIEQKIFSYLDKRVVIYTENDMTTYIPSINHMDQIVFFKEDFIAIYLDMLKL